VIKEDRMFLYKVEAVVSVMHVERACRKFMDKFFKEYNLPMPKIKIVNSITAPWLGRTSYSRAKDKENTLLEVQKSITGDEKTLDRIVAHELIHHWQFMTMYAHPDGDAEWEKYQKERKLGIAQSRGGHGEDFHKWAAKINAVMGKDYVTEKSDMSYVQQIDKEYYLLISPISNYFAWSWTVKPSRDQKIQIQKRILDGSKLFKSKDQIFLTGQKIKKYGRVSVPKDKETMEKLKDLYNSGQNIKPDWPEVLTIDKSPFHYQVRSNYRLINKGDV